MFYELLRPKIKNKREKTLKRGEIIYHEGDFPSNIYFVEEGLVGLFHISETGKETFLRVFGNGSVFGHRSYFAEEDYHATSMALSETKLVFISKDECARICEENFGLLRKMTSVLAKELGVAELRLSSLQDKSANKRVSESMIYLKMKYPGHVWTRKEIAEYSGTTFETVTRVMGDLEKRGLIEKIGRDFKILDEQLVLNIS